MKLDKDVKLISSDAALLIAKATVIIFKHIIDKITTNQFNRNIS